MLNICVQVFVRDIDIQENAFAIFLWIASTEVLNIEKQVLHDSTYM